MSTYTLQPISVTYGSSPSINGVLALVLPALAGAVVYDFVNTITNNTIFTILLGLAIAIFLKGNGLLSTMGLVISAIGIAQYIRHETITIESETSSG